MAKWPQATKTETTETDCPVYFLNCASFSSYVLKLLSVGHYFYHRYISFSVYVVHIDSYDNVFVDSDVRDEG